MLISEVILHLNPNIQRPFSHITNSDWFKLSLSPTVCIEVLFKIVDPKGLSIKLVQH